MPPADRLSTQREWNSATEELLPRLDTPTGSPGSPSGGYGSPRLGVASAPLARLRPSGARSEQGYPRQAKVKLFGVNNSFRAVPARPSWTTTPTRCSPPSSLSLISRGTPITTPCSGSISTPSLEHDVVGVRNEPVVKPSKPLLTCRLPIGRLHDLLHAPTGFVPIEVWWTSTGVPGPA